MSMTGSRFWTEGELSSPPRSSLARSEHSGPLGNPPTGRYCGDRLPGENGTLISTRSSVLLKFRWPILILTRQRVIPRSDHSVANHGFHLTWNSTQPQCGGLVEGVSRYRRHLP